MSEKTTFRALFDAVSSALAFKVEGAILGFTEQIVQRMSGLGVSRTELASKIEASPAYVTKLLKGGTNFTLESMIKVSEALDSDLKIELVPKTSPRDWVVLIEQRYPAPVVEQHVWSATKYRREAANDVIGPRLSCPRVTFDFVEE